MSVLMYVNKKLKLVDADTRLDALPQNSEQDNE
jgi:hypothetical protein